MCRHCIYDLSASRSVSRNAGNGPIVGRDIALNEKVEAGRAVRQHKPYITRLIVAHTQGGQKEEIENLDAAPLSASRERRSYHLDVRCSRDHRHSDEPVLIEHPVGVDAKA